MEKNIINVFLVTTICLAGLSALARAPLARPVPAVIQSIDFDKKILVLTYGYREGPPTMVWNSSTIFIYDGKIVLASELKKGLAVTLFYHSPIFGKPFATRVIWRNAD